MAASNNLSTLAVSNATRRLTVEETRQLVFQMGVPLNVLDDIADEYKGENRKQHYVGKWLNIDPNASWNKLVAGLKKMDMNALASEIEFEHLSRPPIPSTGSPSLLTTSSPSVSAPPVVNTPSHQDTLSTPAPVGSLPPASLTATPAPVGSLPPPPSYTFEQKVAAAKDSVEQLQDEFIDLKSDTKQLLTQREKQNPHFFHKFQDYLLDMPVAKTQVHIQFFTRNEDEILNAKTIQKLFAILSRYCNYSNYEVILHIVKKFCHHELKGRMERYRDSLTSFEKATTVDVYLCAISAHPGGGVREGFIRMTMKINKPPSECTLYEIRVLKESIEQKASLESYAMYIETPGEGSVCVRLLVPWQVHSLVARVLTPEFRKEHLLTEVTVKRWAIQKDYLVIFTKVLGTCVQLFVYTAAVHGCTHLPDYRTVICTRNVKHFAHTRKLTQVCIL